MLALPRTSPLCPILLRSTPPPRCKQDEIICKLDICGITSNNVTYALLGDTPPYDYYKIFPLENDDVGLLPVWGVSTVIESKHADIAIGTRLFGFFPLSEYAVLKPAYIVRSQGNRMASFVVDRPQVSSNHAVYHQYHNCDVDSLYTRKYEKEMVVLRPLFLTAYFLADWLRENNLFGAKRMIVTSASSKTAFSLAHILSRQANRIEVIGLTSRGNVDFVKKTGVYHHVVCYDDLQKDVSTETPTLLVDFAGNQHLASRIEHHLSSHLVANIAVGISHGSSTQLPTKSASKLKWKVFFAPTWIQHMRKTLGGAELQKRMTQSWIPFVQGVSAYQDVKVEYGLEGAKAVFERMAQGSVNPTECCVISFQKDSKV